MLYRSGRANHGHPASADGVRRHEWVSYAALHLTALRGAKQAVHPAQCFVAMGTCRPVCACFAGASLGSVCKPGLPATCSVMVDTGNPGVSLPADVFAKMVTLLGGTSVNGGAGILFVGSGLCVAERLQPFTHAGSLTKICSQILCATARTQVVVCHGGGAECAVLPAALISVPASAMTTGPVLQIRISGSVYSLTPAQYIREVITCPLTWQSGGA